MLNMRTNDQQLHTIQQPPSEPPPVSTGTTIKKPPCQHVKAIIDLSLDLLFRIIQGTGIGNFPCFNNVQNTTTSPPPATLVEHHLDNFGVSQDTRPTTSPGTKFEDTKSTSAHAYNTFQQHGTTFNREPSLSISSMSTYNSNIYLSTPDPSESSSMTSSPAMSDDASMSESFVYSYMLEHDPSLYEEAGSINEISSFGTNRRHSDQFDADTLKVTHNNVGYMGDDCNIGMMEAEDRHMEGKQEEDHEDDEMSLSMSEGSYGDEDPYVDGDGDDCVGDKMTIVNDKDGFVVQREELSDNQKCTYSTTQQINIPLPSNGDSNNDKNNISQSLYPDTNNNNQHYINQTQQQHRHVPPAQLSTLTIPTSTTQIPPSQPSQNINKTNEYNYLLQSHLAEASRLSHLVASAFAKSPHASRMPHPSHLLLHSVILVHRILKACGSGTSVSANNDIDNVSALPSPTVTSMSRSAIPIPTSLGSPSRVLLACMILSFVHLSDSETRIEDWARIFVDAGGLDSYHHGDDKEVGGDRDGRIKWAVNEVLEMKMVALGLLDYRVFVRVEEYA
ncbi:hypothetical protein HDU76_012100, partial [Blyttiomyces sp. JEL0837]